jgi:hypothetical protein
MPHARTTATALRQPPRRVANPLEELSRSYRADSVAIIDTTTEQTALSFWLLLDPPKHPDTRFRDVDLG